MSTHAIKTELRSLLTELYPAKKWSKRATLADLCNYAVHTIRADTLDQKERRALGLAQVLHGHERR